MDSASKTVEEQLADALHRVAELRISLEECIKARKATEQEVERSLNTAKIAREEMQHFAYAASHDLREPLRNISHYAQLLERHYAGDERAKEFVPFIVDGVSRANSLIDNLLRYSRAGGPGKRSAVKLNACVHWALLNLQRAGQESGAQITCGDLPELVADESQMVQLFQNLLDNALKFRTSDPPEIEISAEEGPEFCTVSVRDNGVGIEPRFQEQVFAPFKRLHGKQIPGTGLGLAICRKIVEGHGGRIWVESDGRHGSTFKFTLPIQAAD